MEQFKNLAELIDHHFRLHGDMQLRDIYKMMHQSVFGPEHLDAASCESAIKEEMHSADVAFEEPLLEPISVDASACRVNLRVARTRRLSPALVAEAVRLSVSGFSRSRDELSRLWNETGDVLERTRKEFRIEDFDELTRVLKEQGFPPLHHSGAYRERNRPAYRVLLREKLQRLMRPSSGGAR